MKLDDSAQDVLLRKTITQNLSQDSGMGWQLPVLMVLFVSVVFVAIKTVVHRHESRTLFMQLQKLEKERDKLSAQWSRLKLEQGTTLNQVRVEQKARWDLSMKMPKTSEIRRVREVRKVIVKPMLASPATSSSPSKVALGD